MPSLVALGEQDAQHRVISLAGGGGAAARKQVKKHRVEAFDRGPEAAPRAARSEVLAHDRHRQHPGQRAHGVQGVVDRGPQDGHLAGVASAEHDSQDDRERELAHPLERDHAPVPGRELGTRQLGDHRRERPHPLAVKRALHEPALAQVLLAVEEQDRVRTGERAQELPALPGRRDGRVQTEHRPHRVRAREQDHRLLGPVGADRGRIAKPRVHALKERTRSAHPRDRLPDGGGTRAGWQVHAPILRR